MEEPGGLQSTGRKESDMTEQLHFTFVSLTKNAVLEGVMSLISDHLPLYRLTRFITATER